MNKFLLSCALALLAVPALAADLPVKAAASTWGTAVQPCTVPTASTPLSCSGFYVGLGVGGEGSNANIIGGGIEGSVFAGGITPTIVGGYQYMKGNWIFGAELNVGYTVDTNATANGVGNSFNGWRITEDFKVGGNLAAMFGSVAPITVPPQLASSVLGPYAHVGTSQWQLPGGWASGFVSGAGVMFDIGPRLFGDLRYSYTNFNGAKAGGVVVQNDQSLLFSISYKLTN